jgi:hypothetical protein
MLLRVDGGGWWADGEKDEPAADEAKGKPQPNGR